LPELVGGKDVLLFEEIRKITLGRKIKIGADAADRLFGKTEQIPGAFQFAGNNKRIEVYFHLLFKFF
jgi:hypothetical protein